MSQKIFKPVRGFSKVAGVKIHAKTSSFSVVALPTS